MRYISIILNILLFAVLSFSPIRVKAQDSYTQLDPSNIAKPSGNPGGNSTEAQQLNDLFIFSDESQFTSLCSSLNLENFENSNLQPNSVAGCPGPFNSLTNNNCYSPGALINGFSLIAIPVAGDGSLIVATPFAFGNTQVVVGPNFHDDDSQFTFQNGGDLAVGMELYSFVADATVQVNIFGAGDVLLGTTNAELSPRGAFIGIVSDSGPITKITFTNGIGELFANLSYGDCTLARNIPTISEWGLLAMVGLFGTVALLAIRRRKSIA